MTNPYRANSKRWMIAELAISGKTKQETYDALSPFVLDQVKPLIFKSNVRGMPRQPKPMHEQLHELRYEIGRVWVDLGFSSSSRFESEEIPQEQRNSQQEEKQEESKDDSEKPQARGKRKLREEWEYFKKRVSEIRAKCVQRAENSAPIDEISMRWEEAGARCIPVGIPADALLFAGSLHWSPETRADFGIRDFDFVALSQKVMRERGITEIQRNGMTEKPHELFGYVLLLAEARQPIFLFGMMGTGKSFLLKQLASYLGLDYAETPMSQGATRGDLLGRHTIAGFIPSAFLPIYSGSGLFNFEEIDAVDPALLIVLNNALAGDALYNSADGETYLKSPDFVAGATANTLGLGANRTYNSRERLDAASLDRWRMGRLEISLDESIVETFWKHG